jgi:hypothetical protein
LFDIALGCILGELMIKFIHCVSGA